MFPKAGEGGLPHRVQRVADMILRISAQIVGTQEASFQMLTDWPSGCRSTGGSGRAGAGGRKTSLRHPV